MKTFTYEFQDSGVKVVYKRVSPFIGAEIRAETQRNRPSLPTRIVDEEGPLKGTVEEIPPTPEYIEELRRWEQKSNEFLMRFQIKRAIVEILEPDDWREQVEEYRLERELYIEEMTKLNATFKVDPLPEDDVLVFITYIAMATQDDMNEFVRAVSTRSIATDETVAGVKDSFRTSLQGS